MSKTVVIRGGRLVDARTRSFDFADILVEGDTIREVGPAGMNAPETAAVVSAKDRLLIPGLINTHTHSHANLPRSVGDRWTLELALNTNPAFRGNRCPTSSRARARSASCSPCRKPQFAGA